MNNAQALTLHNILRKGTFHHAAFQSILRDKDGITIRKVTSGAFRFGVNYSKVAKVIAQGLGGGSLNEGDKWVDFPYVLENKDGKLKIRFYSTFNPFHRPNTKYLIAEDGKAEREISVAEIEERGLVAPSKLHRKHNGPLTMFDVFAENVIEIR